MNKHQSYIVAGISTEIGKTVISAILVESLKADYWKPIQSGELDYSDSHKIQAWTNQETVCHLEAYCLNTPMSPHAAADIDGVIIDPNAFKVPQTDKPLIIELAGGLLVPLTEEYMNINLIKDLNKQAHLPVILVSKYYLGSINHTLLSIELLKQHNIPIAGIIFNGKETPSTRDVILKYTGVPMIAHINEVEPPSKEMVLKNLVAKLQ